MKISLHKRFIAKVSIGLLSLILAVCLTFVIRDTVAMQNPDLAIPGMRVKHYHVYMPDESSFVGAYSWRFLLDAAESELAEEEWKHGVHVPVVPGAPMQIEFSYPCKKFTVSVSKDDGDFNFLVNVKDDDNTGAGAISDNGYFFAPTEPGHYTYRIEAYWGVRGSVLYYLKIMISD